MTIATPKQLRERFPYMFTEKHMGRLMDQGIEETLRVALEETQHAAALRKSSPLSTLLSREERAAWRRDTE